MKILVLENVIRCTNLFGEYGKHAVSKEVLTQIFAELQNLVNLERDGGIQSLKDYLNKNNGKSMKGGGEHVWKYRLNDGDRILYTWGKYLSYLQDEDKDSLVLLAYAVHDKQGMAGQKLPTEQHYEDAREILKKRSEFTDDDFNSQEDCEAFCDIVFDVPYQANHVIYVVSDENLATLDLRNLDFKLSEKQSEIIENYQKKQQPTLILGGAGTGKTVLAVHLLNDFASEKKCAYFTQSKELLNSVENKYNSICTHQEGAAPQFWDINEFCHSVLDKGAWSRKNFVETSQFLNDFVANDRNVQHVLKKYNLTPIDLWTEIRGVIKGGTKSDWTRTKLLDSTKLESEFVEPFRALDRKGLIKRNDTNQRLFELNPKWKSMDFGQYDLPDDATDFLNYLIDYFASFDTSKTEMSFDDYKALNEEVSMVELSARKDIYYKCYEEYKKWLELHGYFDDNDLALNAIAKLHEDFVDPQNESSEKMFDFVVVDEIQDYTELQIYLISRLVDSRRLILAGDSKQIVNPTVFNERKLNSLFRDDEKNIALKTEFLTQNFRCQKEVVAVANRIVTKRREKIGAQKHDVDEDGCRDGEKPLCLAWNENNLKKMLGELLKYPSVALLVPNDNVRNQIINLYGEENYRSAQNSLIYTIAEIKGMEYRYVVCCNVLSAYDSMWNEIMGERTAKKTRYRYYFNLFYVSITRAQEFLCVMEQNEKNPLYSDLKSTENLLGCEQSFDVRKLFLDQLRNEDTDWYADAEDNEDAGNYLRALESYRKANADNEDIWRCMAKLAEQERDYDKCVKYLLILDPDDKKINQVSNLKKFMEEVEESSELRKFGDVYLQPGNFFKSGLDLNTALKSVYGDSDSQEFMTALNEFVKRMNSYMGSLVNV